MGSKWVIKVKTNADGSIERCKARIVTQGYSQQEGLDYDKTFSPLLRSEPVHSVIALSAMNNLKLHQMDVNSIATYKRNIQPEGFASGQDCHLKKSLYGLKQSPRCWNQALDVQLKELIFKQSTRGSWTCFKHY